MENAWVVPVIKDHATYVHEYRWREQLISSTNQIIVTSSLQPSSDPEQLLCGRVITVPSSYARRHQDLSSINPYTFRTLILLIITKHPNNLRRCVF